MRMVASGVAIVFFAAVLLGGASRPVAALRGQIVRMARPFMIVGEYVRGFPGVSRERIREEEAERMRLTAAAAETEALKKENQSLRHLLGLKEDETLTATAAANVLFYTQLMGREALVLDAGRDQGIAEGDIVIDENRLLVGEIMEVLPGSSKVSVASNEGSVFSGSLLPLGGNVLVKGIGGRALALELVPYDTPIRDGDVVLWTREGARRGPAIFAGRVTKGASAARGVFKNGRAALLAHPDDLERVLVLTSP